MKIHSGWFNTYLLCVCLLGGNSLAADSTNAVPAKEAPKKKKESKRVITGLRIHLEVPEDGSDREIKVSVLRGNPIVVNIEKAAFLNEAILSEARIIETPGSVEIELQFDVRGRQLLENYTAANRGRRFAIFCDFGEKRWLAAPVMNRLLSNGTLRFAPDATKEEAERIVRGLNRVAELRKKKEAF